MTNIKSSIRYFLSILAVLSISYPTVAHANQTAQETPAAVTGTRHFIWLGLGEVKPDGWIREQMVRDLKEGFAGHLDELCKEANSDIFVIGRNGLKQANTTNAAHCQWWNGETEGNWWAGFIMMAYLTNDKDSIAKADTYVAHILASQDSDGYMGINSPKLRYTAGGELWTQACLLRGLLAYAELTDKKEVLKAVELAVHCTMNALTGKGTSIKYGVAGHDLMFCDVLERLFDLTGDVSYRDFGKWLYENACKAAARDDSSLRSLLDSYAGLVGHGVDTYEQIRVPLWLWSVTGREDMDTAWRNGIDKISRYCYPGGAAVSQEYIDDCPPNPTFTEFEYCAAKELQWSWESALQKTGEARFADRTELIWFNDEQGGRLTNGSALTYLTNENRLRCDDMTPDGLHKQTRNRFSPTQRQVAVCCPPNATQVAALYVRGMWMRQGDGNLAALLYGPCTVSTKVNGVAVKIEEKTNYPFDNNVEILLQPEQPVEMTLLFRNPAWSRDTILTCEGAEIVRKGMYWQVHKKWNAGDMVRIGFTPTVRTITAVNGEVALQYGALVFAKPIPAKETVVANYPVKGFKDLYLEPTEKTDNTLAFPHKADSDHPISFTPSGAVGNVIRPPGSPVFEPFKARRMEQGADWLRPFDSPVIVLEGTMVDTAAQNAPRSVTLVPLGNANQLRRVTFPVFYYVDQPVKR